ncbi:hypothetical protein Acr_24g0002810 [Actinidia rufa]|uniref:Uncharacterized protein n=1 Tax=Actinidia rufa TaxID=165716 RepID=A0A7J0GTN5_9ERIC|nr:hypothetical protein Acr_24g0002810 [Actinidia rufa]
MSATPPSPKLGERLLPSRSCWTMPRDSWGRSRRSRADPFSSGCTIRGSTEPVTTMKNSWPIFAMASSRREFMEEGSDKVPEGALKVVGELGQAVTAVNEGAVAIAAEEGTTIAEDGAVVEAASPNLSPNFSLSKNTWANFVGQIYELGQSLANSFLKFLLSVPSKLRGTELGTRVEFD